MQSIPFPTMAGITRFVVATPDGRLYYGTTSLAELSLYVTGGSGEDTTCSASELVFLDFDQPIHRFDLETRDLRSTPDLGVAIDFLTDGGLSDPMGQPQYAEPTSPQKPQPDEWEQVEI